MGYDQDTAGGAQAQGDGGDGNGRDLPGFADLVAALSEDIHCLLAGPSKGSFIAVLEHLAVYAGAEQAFVLSSASPGEQLALDDVWAAVPLGDNGPALQDIAPAHLPWIHQVLRSGQTICVGGAEQLPAEAGADASYLANRRIGALLLAPMLQEGRLHGAIGIERASSEPWPRELIALLNVAAGSLSGLLERRRFSAELADSEARYRNIVDAVREGIWMLDKDGITTFVNEPMAELLGYTPIEMVGCSVFEFMPEQEEMAARTRLRNTRGGSAASYEREFTRRDGTSLWTMVAVSPRHAGDGTYLGSVAMVLNNQDRKLQESLRVAENHILELVATDAGLESVLEVVARTIEDVLQQPFCAAVGAVNVDGRVTVLASHTLPAGLAARLRGMELDAGSESPFCMDWKAIQCLKDDGLDVVDSRWIRAAGGEPLGFLLLAGGEDLPADLVLADRLEGATRHARIALESDRIKRRLEENEARLRTLVEHAPEAIVVIDGDTGLFNDVNENAVRLFGLPRHKLIGQAPWMLSPPQQADGEASEERAREMMELAIQGEAPVFEWLHRAADGRLIPTEIRLVRLPSSEGALIRGSITDVSERVAAEHHLRQLATRDHLTGLANRNLFLERLRHAIAIARRQQTGLAVMFLDLDRFKNVNDNLGHAVGDRLLVQVANALEKCLRESDTIARLGGDEFTVLLENVVELRDAAKVAEKIRAAVTGRITVDGHELFVTPSIGISTYPKNGSDVESLLKAADTAMYSAKELGGNGYQFFTNELNERAAAFMRLESRLHHAIERGELSLYYQPKLSLRTGEVTGMEALMRWDSAELGRISPAEFIPVAEDTGLIVAMGEWALREACRQGRVWMDARLRAGLPPLRVSVNLSARQLRQTRLDGTVEAILLESGLAADCLELEITESMVIKNPIFAIDTLRRIREQGVRIAVDDFGTGYSSLGYLKRLPIDTVKIDHSFVKDITTDAEDLSITEAVIAMAHALDLEVVAEGVETVEQLALLGARACDQVQGYLFGRPVPAAEIDVSGAEIAAHFKSLREKIGS